MFTAHSIPQAMADGCRYEAQLREACRLVAEGAGRDDWQLVYQSRSGPPQQPWLEPDVLDFLRQRQSRQPLADVAVAPIGFTSDHLEVLYDLDTEAKGLCDELGIHMVRAATVGTHPRFIRMIRELVEERLTDTPNRLALGALGPKEDVCPDDCCVYTPSAARPHRESAAARRLPMSCASAASVGRRADPLLQRDGGLQQRERLLHGRIVRLIIGRRVAASGHADAMVEANNRA